MSEFKPLVWDQTGEKLFETGVEKGVLYPFDTKTNAYAQGVAWNGLTSVQENPSGGESTDIYADNDKYLDITSAEKMGLTIEAYMYPDEFAECDGSASIATGVTIKQQPRKMFGFCYQTKIGNDVSGIDYGYKINLVYGCKAAPSSKTNSTVNESPEASTLSWTVNTTPVAVPGFKKSAMLTINSTKCPAEKLAELEKIIYGSETANAKLPLPEEVISIVGTDALGE